MSDATVEALITNNGTDEFAATSTLTLAATTWALLGMSFDSSTSLILYHAWDGGNNGQLTKIPNTSSIPASIFNGTQTLALGSRSGANYTDGKIGLSALAAATWDDKIFNLTYTQTRKLLVV